MRTFEKYWWRYRSLLDEDMQYIKKAAERHYTDTFEYAHLKNEISKLCNEYWKFIIRNDILNDNSPKSNSAKCIRLLKAEKYLNQIHKDLQENSILNNILNDIDSARLAITYTDFLEKYNLEYLAELEIQEYCTTISGLADVLCTYPAQDILQKGKLSKDTLKDLLENSNQIDVNCLPLTQDKLFNIQQQISKALRMLNDI